MAFRPKRSLPVNTGSCDVNTSSTAKPQGPASAQPARAPERVLQVRSRTRVSNPVQPEMAQAASVSPPAPVAVTKANSGKAKKETKQKKQPTGDYETGYCRPPVETRFDGSKPGPGRPRGAVSQDTLLKKHLTQVRPVAIEGKQTKLQVRELVLMLRVKEALSGNGRSADYVLAEAARLFSERVAIAEHGSPLPPGDIDEHDRAILEAFEAALLARVRGEGDEAASDNDNEEGDGPDELDPVE